MDSQVKRTLINKFGNTFLGAALLLLTIALLIASVEYWSLPTLYLGIESLYLHDLSIWSIAMTSGVLLVVLIWVTLAFSLVALISALCVCAALVMMFAGFSLIWPVALLVLAAWGVGKASQVD